MMVVHNGIDTTQFTPNPVERIDAAGAWTGVKICVAGGGAASDSKGVSGFAEGDEPVAGECGTADLRAGPLRAELEAAAARFGVASRVRFLGMRKNVRA